MVVCVTGNMPVESAKRLEDKTCVLLPPPPPPPPLPATVPTADNCDAGNVDDCEEEDNDDNAFTGN